MLMFSTVTVLIGALGVLALVVLYPLFLVIAVRIAPTRLRKDEAYLPSVTVLTATRNAADFIDAKIDNTFALDYPADKINMVITLDGRDPLTEKRVLERGDSRIQLVTYDSHLGKASAINRALPQCTHDVLLMTDADALLDSQALRRLVCHLADERVGGVGGRRVIRRDQAQMKEAQQSYISADSGIKAWESRLGYTTANDGKLYAVRRELIDEIAEGVTDDLYAALKVVSSGRRFLFEPRAFAEIKVPSRHPMHEITRRRRVVCRSLTGIWRKREVLNPFQYGMFSIGLLINKVLRRLLPVFLILLFVGSLSLAVAAPWTWPLLAVQSMFYVLAASYVVPMLSVLHDRAGKLSQTAFYFCIGNYGTLLGLFDFLAGKRVLRWEPVKQDQPT